MGFSNSPDNARAFPWRFTDVERCLIVAVGTDRARTLLPPLPSARSRPGVDFIHKFRGVDTSERTGLAASPGVVGGCRCEEPAAAMSVQLSADDARSGCKSERNAGPRGHTCRLRHSPHKKAPQPNWQAAECSEHKGAKRQASHDLLWWQPFSQPCTAHFKTAADNGSLILL